MLCKNRNVSAKIETERNIQIARMMLHAVLNTRQLFSFLSVSTKPRFCFKTTELNVRAYIYSSIGKKWSSGRQRLWYEFNDPLKTKAEIMDNVPSGIPRDQWTSYVAYHFNEKTMEMSKRNAEIRKKQTVSHTGGSKPNSRRRAEMEKNELVVIQSATDESEVSPNDAVGKVLGKEHFGRVRCLELGAIPKKYNQIVNAHNQSQEKYNRIVNAHNQTQESYAQMMTAHHQMMNAFKTYMIMKEGTIPEQFAGIFVSPPLAAPSDAACGSISPMGVRGSSSDSNLNENH
ncbi:uncharacterized protein [Nicotiana sylvestris]|uniref:uncharacterized protein n=1 Tax=Nicotiana sylvestris TaxID=4096 RepID=UPI00388CC186